MLTLYIVKATVPEFGTVYLTDYIGKSKADAGNAVLVRAHAEGYRGTLKNRLKELGWEIVSGEFTESIPR